MIRLVALLVVVGFVVWLALEFRYARKKAALRVTRNARGRPMMPPVRDKSDAELERRAAELRKAAKRGDITFDEAVGSLIRFAGGGMTTDGARRFPDL